MLTSTLPRPLATFTSMQPRPQGTFTSTQPRPQGMFKSTQPRPYSSATQCSRLQYVTHHCFCIKLLTQDHTVSLSQLPVVVPVSCGGTLFMYCLHHFYLLQKTRIERSRKKCTTTFCAAVPGLESNFGLTSETSKRYIRYRHTNHNITNAVRKCVLCLIAAVTH